MSDLTDHLRELADDPRFARPENYPEPSWLMAAVGKIEDGEWLRDLIDDFLPRLGRASHPGIIRSVGKCGDCGKSTPCGDQVTCDRCTRKLVAEMHRKITDLLYPAERLADV